MTAGTKCVSVPAEKLTTTICYSVFSIICYINISVNNYRRPVWMAKVFLAAFHIVFVTFVFIFVCICIVENKIFFLSTYFHLSNVRPGYPITAIYLCRFVLLLLMLLSICRTSRRFIIIFTVWVKCFCSRRYGRPSCRSNNLFVELAAVVTAPPAWRSILMTDLRDANTTGHLMHDALQGLHC